MVREEKARVLAERGELSWEEKLRRWRAEREAELRYRRKLAEEVRRQLRERRLAGEGLT